MYTSKVSLIKDGRIVAPGTEVELTAEQAKFLGDKVEKKPTRKTTKKDEEGGE